MNKSIHFTGQPTFAQLIKLVPKDLIARQVADSRSDYYYKKFTTSHHLNAMLFACFGHCHSLREVVSGMRALEGRLQRSKLTLDFGLWTLDFLLPVDLRDSLAF